MKRREFLLKSGLAVSGMIAANKLQLGNDLYGNQTETLEMNTLGRTGVKVSKLGFGCFELGRDSITQEEVDLLVTESVNLGINYFDTAPNYNAAEERMGRIIPSVRDKIFLVSKTEAPDYDGTWQLLEQSLKRLKTDNIDLIHIHNFGHQKRFENTDFVLSEKGALGALLKAKEQGIIRFIGASGHVYPTRFHKAIDNEHIDVLMNAVNFVIRHVYNFEEKVWLRAMEKNIGLVAMKVLGGPADNKESRISRTRHETALRYVYSLPGLSTAVIGMKNLDELTNNVNFIKNIKPLNESEMSTVLEEGLKLSQDEKWKKVHGTPLI